MVLQMVSRTFRPDLRVTEYTVLLLPATSDAGRTAIEIKVTSDFPIPARRAGLVRPLRLAWFTHIA